MDKRAVQDFYTNQAMRDSVRDYIEGVIREEAVEMVFERQDVFYIADAKELIDKAFKRMETEFKVTKNNSTLNQSR